jgi:predicted DCC family thiol-disulfide oxidoreductase YuxK
MGQAGASVNRQGPAAAVDVSIAPGPVILFDGVCNVCSRLVQFVIPRDPAGRFRFGALQSDEGRRLLAGVGAPSGLDTMVLVDGGRVYTRSAAALRVIRGLAFPWWLAYALIVVPAPLRDGAYNLFARHRYAWFGRREQCLVPTREIQSRFIH